MLSERKKKILQAVINEYIENASPVASKSIQEDYFDDLSSATIRNELASLEDMGLLTHPHTSAGRVPTNLAYKMYIDELIDRTTLSDDELDSMKKYFSANIKETEYVANQVVKVLSDMTDYTTVAVKGGSEKDRIKSLKLIKLSDNIIVMIAVLENGEVNDFRVYGNFLKGDEYIKSAETLLNKHVVGRTYSELEFLSDTVKTELSEYKELFVKLFSALKEKIKEKSGLLLEGESKIFEHPEYNNIDSVKDFLTVIDSKEKLHEILSESDKGIKVNVSFGGEDKNLPKDCTVVTAHYLIDDIDYGTYGVIGPVRMDYNKVIKVLNGIRDVLEDMSEDDKKQE